MRAKPRAHGFSIIEIMAVVLIIGLLMTLVLPNLGSRRAAGLRDQARVVAGYLELARQRAIVTGKPHRLFLALEEGLRQGLFYPVAGALLAIWPPVVRPVPED